MTHDPFTPAAWHKLVAALRADDSPAAVVLYILASTGLRVGDVLQINRESFRLADKRKMLMLSRGAEFLAVPFIAQATAWRKLKRAWKSGDNVAEWLCPGCAGDPTSAGGAYRQLDRKLKLVAKAIGLRGRVHLHRIRRTIAMQELRAGKAIDRVQKKLGHRSTQATSRYVD